MKRVWAVLFGYLGWIGWLAFDAYRQQEAGAELFVSFIAPAIIATVVLFEIYYLKGERPD